MDLNQIVNNVIYAYRVLEPDLGYAIACVGLGTLVAYHVERSLNYDSHSRHNQRYKQRKELAMTEPKTYPGKAKVAPEQREYLSVDDLTSSLKV